MDFCQNHDVHDDFLGYDEFDGNEVIIGDGNIVLVNEEQQDTTNEPNMHPHTTQSATRQRETTPSRDLAADQSAQ